MRVKPKRIIYKLKQYKVPFKLVPGWDDPKIDPYKGRCDFQGIVLHHTAGVNSLRYIAYTNPYAPVRACHFLVDRDGTVRVVSGSGAYHAGQGGPWRFPKKRGFQVVTSGNSSLWGIEIESLGTSRKIDGSLEGMTVDQVVSTSLLCAALLNAGRPGWRSWPVSRVISHKMWAPKRKIDVRQDIDWWHVPIGFARRHGRKNPELAKMLIKQFVKEHPKGRL